MLSGRDYILAYSVLAIVYIAGLFVPLMNNDSAHHADIALRIYLTNDYATLIDHGVDYLDKPHLHFWLSALSYSIFGVNTFAYKFPSFLFGILSLYATFRLGTLLYSRSAGKLAALILATALSYVIAHNDVRMDVILTSCIIFSIWQLVVFTNTEKWKNLVLAGAGLAAGFSTKGMIGIAMPAIAIFLHLLYQRNWRLIFHWKWLALGFFILVFITPVLYAYYLQFDLHPEKVIRGQSHISGIKFILWSQNFERLEGTKFGSSGKNDPFFFVHTFLWSFLPWSLLLIAAYWKKTRQLIGNRFVFSPGLEAITWSTVTVIFFIISASGFKLPHYLTILLPLYSILLAGYLVQPIKQKTERALMYTQIPVFVITILFAGALNLWIFPINNGWVGLLSIGLLGSGILYLWRRESQLEKAILFSVMLSLFNTLLLNLNFYPQLLTYQAGNTLAESAIREGKEINIVYLQGFEHSNSFDFYLHELIPEITTASLSESHKSLLLYTGNQGKKELDEKGIPYVVRYIANDYRVSRLSFKFINPDTRASALQKHYLLEIAGK